jgi:hypothetical protein
VKTSRGWVDGRSNQLCIDLEGIEEPDQDFLFNKARRYAMSFIHDRAGSWLTVEARIITHAPLRAKEAPLFASNKYPVVVCKSSDPCLNLPGKAYLIGNATGS